MFSRVLICLAFLTPSLVDAETLQRENFVRSKAAVLEALQAKPSDLFNSQKEIPLYQYESDNADNLKTKKATSPFLEAILDIQKNPKLQNDSQIQGQLLRLFRHHPYTHIRTTALSALPLDHPEHAAFNNKNYHYSNIPKISYSAIQKEINESVGYCTYGKPLKPCSSCNTDEETAALTPIQNGKKMKNIRVTARDVEGGKLAGYSYFLLKHGFGYYSDYHSQNDLGLHYIPSEDELPTKFIYPENIRYISHQKNDKTFWGVTSWPGKCGQSSIVKITERSKGRFDVQPHTQLPGTVEGVGEGKNGDLYLYFGNEDSFARQCKPITMAFEISRYSNNPPIIFTTDGNIRSACETDAKQF